MKLKYPEGATPIDPDEQEGLILTHITTHEELNRWEQENINRADQWCNSRKHGNLLTMDFTLKLHKKMFGDVWKWAGQFRTSGKNIGVPAWQISAELKKLLDDFKAWLEYRPYNNDEMAVRFHHRLVSIHLFANGNGRHARMMTNLIQKQILDEKEFTWGRTDLSQAGDCRKRYIESLQAADNNDYIPLLNFARS
ncbi:MAG: mobile mystery protein B [Candidatus Omnitrophota bacterium]|nr:mobile mystery protein B [Candidatus Omnitrophota bacterium]